MKKITKADVKAFFTLDRRDVVQLAVMAGVLLMGSDVSFASEAASEAKFDGDIKTLTGPLERIQNFMTGTVGKSIATIGAVVFGASWAANIENQVTKSAMRIAGGGAIAVGGGAIVGEVASGFLF